MMLDRMALKIAIDLMHVPSQVRLFRSEPLPDGVLMLLRIAAGDEEAETMAVDLTGRSPEIVRQATRFFIEQILFAPEADSYRALGANPQASPSELRRNVALLLRSLHPDVDRRGERSIFVGRVTTAWNNLKTPERRTAYDNQLLNARAHKGSRSRTGKSHSGRQNSARAHTGGTGQSRSARNAPLTQSAAKVGFLRRALSVLFHRPLQ
jgi:DnaJ-like protein